MPRTIVIGDIHACWDELRDLLDRVALTDADTLVSVGDLVDRGPDPASVLDLFRSRPNTVAVCGNHERKHVRGRLSRSQEITRAQLAERYADDVAWMGTLPYHWTNGQLLVVHAAVQPGLPPAETPEEILCGTTSGAQRLDAALGGRRWHELYEGPVPVVFGHHVVEPPLVRDGLVYGIDTGACHGMALTALVWPTGELVSVPARADHWRVVGRKWEVAALASHPWDQMTFAQLERKAADLSLHAGPEGAAWLDAKRAWAEAQRARIPGLAAALDALVSGLVEARGADGFSEAAAAHPASDLLFRWRAGRLSSEHLGCAGPGDVDRLAARLA